MDLSLNSFSSAMSTNVKRTKKKLFLLLANSDSEVLMNAIRQENKIPSASTAKRFFFCNEYDFISRKCKRLEQEKAH